MAVEFRDGYVERLTSEGVSRGDALRSRPVAELIQNRADLTPAKKNKLISALTDVGGQEITLEQILEKNNPARVAFFEQIVDKGSTGSVKALVGDFKGILAEVGVTAQGTTNPLRSMLKEDVGTARYEKGGFKTDTARLRPIKIPAEVYQATKDVAASLISSTDPTEKAAGYRMAMMMLGGYRPSDFKAFSIENIDFQDGIVTGLELKTDTGVSGIGVAYLPRAQMDIVKQAIGDRTSGLVFENPEALDKIINSSLKTADIPKVTYRQESTGKVIKGDFTAYDFRRMQETTLQAAGYKSTDPIRKYLTWRPLTKSEASEGYMAILNQSAEIEQANALSFEPYVHMTEGNTVQLSEGQVIKTHGQFLTDIGITELSPFTKKYVASQAGKSKLPITFQEMLEGTDEGVSYPKSSILETPSEVNPQAAKEYLETANINKESRRVQAQINLQEKKQKLADMPMVSPTDNIDKGVAAGNLQDELMSKGLDFNKILDRLGKSTKTILPVAAGIELGRQLLDAPLDTLGELAKEAGLETAARIAGLGTAPAAAVPMTLAATPAGEGSARFGPGSSDAPLIEETDEDRMARIATEDAGFIPEANRVPEAAPTKEEGFIPRVQVSLDDLPPERQAQYR